MFNYASDSNCLINIMIQRTICFFAALIIFMLHTTAQKHQVNSIEWKVAGTLPAINGQANIGLAGPVAGIHHDILMVGGGANFPDGMPWLGGKKKYHDDLFVFKKRGDSMVHYKTFKLPFPIAYSATCSTPRGVLSVGGENENGITDKSFLIQWNEKNDSTNVKQLPSLPFEVTNASVVFDDNKIYVTGGETANAVSSNFLVLDLTGANPTWKNMPSLLKPVSHGVMVVHSSGSSNSIFLIGGRKKNPGSTSDLYASTYEFNFSTNRWVERKSLPHALSAGTGISINHSKILLFGGDTGETFHKTEKLIAAINRDADAEKKHLLNEEKIKLQSSHPGFCGQVFLYDVKKDKWSAMDCIPFDVPVTTTAVLWKDEVFIPSGEIKAGVRTPQILNGKINLSIR